MSILLKNMKREEFQLGLSYDDVLLVPQYSDIPSRKLIDCSTQFSKRISLHTPIVSANMDTVTESRMAIAMAHAGGIGVIHRFLTIDEEAAAVKKVKRAQNVVIDDPVTIEGGATLGAALEVMRANGITGVLVCDREKNIQGILTSRDVRFKKDLSAKIKTLMTPRAKLVTAPKGITPEKALALLDAYKIEKLPLMDKRGKLTGLITATDFKKMQEFKNAACDKDGQLLVAAAVGVKDGESRARALVGAGVDALIIDIAHGHHTLCAALTRTLKKRLPNVDVIAGNIATPEAAQDLIKSGADALKVGIGPGAACSTRIVAGAGVPQFSAIRAIAGVARKTKTPIIADGGVKNSGDVAKAIGAGANTVMIGNLFSGSFESPGEYYIEDGAAFKIFRGMASRDASFDRPNLSAGSGQGKESLNERIDRAPEGISFRVTYKGEVQKILAVLIDGLQSGMSYSGARTIREFWRKAQFIRMTEAGFKESAPRNYQQ